MMFFDGDGIFAGIMVLMAGAIALFVLFIAQAIRAMQLPGWRKVLYPGQMILGFWAMVIGAGLPWMVYVTAIGSVVLTWLTRREDPDLKWFATLSGIVTLAACALTIWAA
ncbi:MAG: hypothetical protein AB8B82_06470 [Roseovarius sp.]